VEVHNVNNGKTDKIVINKITTVYIPQAGPSNYNPGYKPAPYNKFGKNKPNYRQNNNQNPGYKQNNSAGNGPNWEWNRQNCANKKQAKQVLLQKVASFEQNQSKTDKKGKGKEKATPKVANLLARIDDIPLINRMEEIDSFNERVFITPESNKTNVVEQTMDVDDDAISLGSDFAFEDARDLYARCGEMDGDMTKYGDGLLKNKFAKKHTVKTMVEKVNKSSKSSLHYSSNVENAAKCHKTVYTVQRVIQANKKIEINLHTIESNDTWIIDSGASHHITNSLSDFTNYKPYASPQTIQTANVKDSLKIHGEGTVFFNTETTNGQIHTVRLDNVCYIPNGSNQLLSRGQLCWESGCAGYEV
jgi:hypothetical protein